MPGGQSNSFLPIWTTIENDEAYKRKETKEERQSGYALRPTRQRMLRMRSADHLGDFFLPYYRKSIGIMSDSSQLPPLSTQILPIKKYIEGRGLSIMDPAVPSKNGRLPNVV
jgi:hypothetical protein